TILFIYTSLCFFLGSCVGRCGEAFSRGQQCTCDLQCASHSECCQDFQAVCATAQSCRGRCGEPFVRGLLCNCDPQCVQFNTCCPDYLLQCGMTFKLQNLIIIYDTPISGLTALSNGTIVIFKGEWFWTVDPESHYISPPNSISKILGIPSHIDTVFTRSNCQANVYVFKGNLYWRFDRNLVLEPGFPKPLSHEFPGLTPGLTAALSAPATVSRAETVYFFRRGEIIQRFTFPSTNIPSCSITPRGFIKPQVAQVLLSHEIQIKVSMKGFPVPITSALTTPIPMKANTYEHYVFSGPLFFSVSVAEDLPALVGPNHPRPVVLSAPAAVETSITNVVTVISDPPPPPENSLKVWLQCPA
uniref:SMB domain-containing protein n=1 Tax=Periophthalmus magnuspinnatus TaxID=409849 RepID=A0A3B4B307_9GOBI